MSDMDTPYRRKQRFWFKKGLITLLIVFTCVSETGVSATFVYSGPSKVASKDVFLSDCVDSAGVTRSHLDTWSSSATSCDINTCIDRELLKFKVTESCFPSDVNVDPDNCQYVADQSQAFPNCCPVLQCATANVVDVTTPACFDRSDARACTIWKDEFGCANSPDPILQAVYNITLENCRLSCGYC